MSLDVISWTLLFLLIPELSGRGLDGAPPALYTLLELNKYCPEVLKKCEVCVDRWQILTRDGADLPTGVH